MTEDHTHNLTENQDWLQALGEKSDTLVNSAVQATGKAGETTKEALIHSRLLGHTRHPTITDVPLGSWTVTLITDVWELVNQEQRSSSSDVSLVVGLVASLLASAGGVADLSETHRQTDRSLGMRHGLLQGVTLALYGGSLVARRSHNQKLGRILSFVGYGTLLVASNLASKLAQQRAKVANSEAVSHNAK